MIERIEGWEAALFEAIEARSQYPFDFKKHDCCRAGADLVKAMTGHDLMRGLRGYRSAAGAMRVIKENGGDLLSLVKGRCEAAGWPQVAKSMARRGDIAFTAKTVSDGINGAFGVFDGVGAIFPTDRGWARLPISDVETAFRVG